MLTMNLNLLVTVPHAGEDIPSEVNWLQGLPEPHLMRDVDRYVDRIYKPIAQRLNLPFIGTQWHRYVVDLNRFPHDFDAAAVQGASQPGGTHPKGLHWCVTTLGEPLIHEPMSQALHENLVKNFYRPFHDEVSRFREHSKKNKVPVFHLDCHSMPSEGTSLHADPGQERPHIVISDYHGQTCHPELRDLVMAAYQKVGFDVGYNFPYVGGGVTRMYGDPDQGFHNLQIELNRRLYMDENTKKTKPEEFVQVQTKIEEAFVFIVSQIQGLEIKL